MAAFTFVGNENASNGTSLNVVQGINNVDSATAFSDGFGSSRLVSFRASATDGSNRTAEFDVVTDGSNHVWWTGIAVASPIAGGGSATVLTAAGFNSAIPITYSNIFSPGTDAVVVNLLANMFAGSDRFDVSGQVSSIWGDYQTAPSSPPAVLGNDFIVVAGSTTVASGSTSVTIYGDALQFITGATVTAGNDIIEGTAAIVGLTLYGDFATASGAVTYGSDSLFGGSQADTIYGDTASSTAAGGNDSLMGNGGDDVLFGGGGNDRLNGGVGADALDGGAGFDVAWYTLPSASTGIVDLLNPGANTGDAAGDTFIGIEGIRGRDFDFGGADDLRGDNLANSLWGMAGDDQLAGRGGADMLYGGLGADALDGGAGFDYARYDQATSGLTVRLDIPGHNTGEAAGDTFVGVEGLVGSGFTDVLVGNGIANTLFGLSGNDTLHGLGGNDQLRGGAGVDTLLGGIGADALIGETGNDYASYALAAAGVTARLDMPGLNTGEAAGDTYITIEGLVGSNFADTLVGNGAANVVFGQGGNDALHGVGGNDQLRGGAGNDVLLGGAGNDLLLGDTGADSFVFRNGEQVDTIQGFENNIDTIRLDDNLWGGGKSVAQVLATYATQGANFVDLNFGDGDLLRVSQAGITIAALQDDILII